MPGAVSPPLKVTRCDRGATTAPHDVLAIVKLKPPPPDAPAKAGEAMKTLSRVTSKVAFAAVQRITPLASSTMAKRCSANHSSDGTSVDAGKSMVRSFPPGGGGRGGCSSSVRGRASSSVATMSSSSCTMSPPNRAAAPAAAADGAGASAAGGAPLPRRADPPPATVNLSEVDTPVCFLVRVAIAAGLAKVILPRSRPTRGPPRRDDGSVAAVPEAPTATAAASAGDGTSHGSGVGGAPCSGRGGLRRQ